MFVKCSLTIGAITAGLLIAATSAMATVTITSGPPQHTNSPSASFTFSTNPPQGTECAVDGAPSYAACSSPYQANGLGEGAHTFYVRTVGGTPGQPATWSWHVDLTAPDTLITSGPSGFSNAAVPQFTFSATEPSAFQCALDGAFFGPCSSPDSLQGLSDGTHTLQVRAVDLAGNADGTPASQTWTRDTVPPPQPVVQVGPRVAIRSARGRGGFVPTGRDKTLTSTSAFQTTRTLRVQWLLPVPTPGITFSVAYQKLTPATGGSTTFTPIKTAAKTRALAFTASTGHEYCFRVTATDQSGNTSQRVTCTTVPFAATKVQRGGVIDHTGPGYYLGQYVKSKLGFGYLRFEFLPRLKKGQKKQVWVKRIAVVATTCPTCGHLEVILSSREQPGGGLPPKKPYLKDVVVSLKSSSTKKKQLIPVMSFTSPGPTDNDKLFVLGFGEVGQYPDVEGVGIAAR